MITSTEIKDIKAKIKAEMQRRHGNGSLAGYADSSWDFSISPETNTTIIADQGNKVISPLIAVKSQGNLKEAVTGQKIPSDFNAENLYSIVNTYTSEATTTPSSSCTASCSGLCTSGCYTECSSCTGSCRGSCTGGCKNKCKGCDGSCVDSCASYCSKSCEEGCRRTCSYICQDSCSRSCQNSCQSTCHGGNNIG